jgi:hypothetical protein
MSGKSVAVDKAGFSTPLWEQAHRLEVPDARMERVDAALDGIRVEQTVYDVHDDL